MNDRGPGKRLLLPSILVALFLLFASLSVVYIRSEQRLNRLVAEYQVDKTAAALLERAMNEVFLADLYHGGFRRGLGGAWSAFDDKGLAEQLKDLLPVSARGFGVYRDDGSSLSAVLAAPTEIAPPRDDAEESFRFEPRTQSIALVRRIGAPFGGPVAAMRMRGMGPMMWGGGEPFGGAPRGGHRPAGGPRGLDGFGERGEPNRPAYLYLDLSLPSFFREKSVLDIALVAVPLAIGAILVTIGLLVNRNRQYRERIDAQRNLVRLGEIARTLSHEIKNPLSAIKLQTAILRRTLGANRRPSPSSVEDAHRGLVSPEAGTREISLIEEETERVSRLVERIGEYLRDPLGTPEAVDLFQFTSDLLARFPWPVRPPDPPSDRLAVRFDPDRLRTVLENLVKNGVESALGESRQGEERERERAADAGAARTSAAPVSVMLQPIKGRVELIVADRGPGISQEDADRLFDPFFTTKVRGMGVGLAISKRFVEAAGGTLRLRPGRDGGAEAVVTLPRWAA